MTAIETVTVELKSNPHLWWGHHASQGWVVLDREDVRNEGNARHLIRCRDWSQFEVSRTDFGSDQFALFKRYLAALPDTHAREECDRLLALHREFAARAASFRVTKEQRDRERQEADRQAFQKDGWLTCDSPSLMLTHLPGNVSVRKLRLFGIACCRRIWRIMKDDDCRQAVRLADRFVEGTVAPEEARRVCADLEQKRLAAIRGDIDLPETNVRIWCLAAARSLFQAADDSAPDDALNENADLLLTWEFVGSAFTHAHVKDYSADPTPKLFREYRAQADLLREILGHPFQPVAFDPEWRTPTVLGIAHAIYDEQAFDRLPILADALEDVGCSNEEILGHCRGKGRHTRGCWLLDLFLEKS
jgi:hypothetical protein